MTKIQEYKKTLGKYYGGKINRMWYERLSLKPGDEWVERYVAKIYTEETRDPTIPDDYMAQVLLVDAIAAAGVIGGEIFVRCWPTPCPPHIDPAHRGWYMRYAVVPKIMLDKEPKD